MAKYKIEVIKEDCTGCMACNASCPESFEMKDDDSGIPKAKPKKAVKVAKKPAKKAGKKK